MYSSCHSIQSILSSPHFWVPKSRVSKPKGQRQFWLWSSDKLCLTKCRNLFYQVTKSFLSRDEIFLMKWRNIFNQVTKYFWPSDKIFFFKRRNLFYQETKSFRSSDKIFLSSNKIFSIQWRNLFDQPVQSSGFQCPVTRDFQRVIKRGFPSQKN